MFAFDRSSAAVLMPLALLVAVVLWSNHETSPGTPAHAQHGTEVPAEQDRDQTVAANFASR